MKVEIKNNDQFIEVLQSILWSYLYARIYRKATGFNSIDEMNKHLKEKLPLLENYYLKYRLIYKEISFENLVGNHKVSWAVLKDIKKIRIKQNIRYSID